MFEILQHTADVRLRVSAPTMEGLFRDAMRGMFAIMLRDSGFGIRDSGGAAARVVVESADRTALLVDFLSAVLSRAHIDRMAFYDANFDRLTETELAADLTGAPTQFEHDIKAVTYHEAEVRLAEGKWETMLVFDI